MIQCIHNLKPVFVHHYNHDSEKWHMQMCHFYLHECKHCAFSSHHIIHTFIFLANIALLMTILYTNFTDNEHKIQFSFYIAIFFMIWFNLWFIKSMLSPFIGMENELLFNWIEEYLCMTTFYFTYASINCVFLKWLFSKCI